MIVRARLKTLDLAVVGLLLTAPTGIALAAQPISGPLGPCPDATAAEVSLFKNVPVPSPRIEDLGEIKLAGMNVSTQAHKAAFFEDIGKAYAQLVQQEATLKSIMVVPFRTLESGGNMYEIAACFTQSGVDGFSFMPSVAVSTYSGIPEAMNTMAIAPARYAVFTYKGPADGTGNFRYSITTDFFPKSDLKRSPAPNLEVTKVGADQNDASQTIEEWYPIQ